MRVRLTVDYRDITRPVDVEVDPAESVANFAAFVRQLAEAPARAQVVVERTGSVLAGAGPLAYADLRSGDRLLLGRAQRPAGDAGRRLVIAAGLGAGRSIPLAGATSVGRADSSTLRLADPLVSAQHLDLTAEGGTVRLRDRGSANGTFVDGTPVVAPTVVPDGASIEVGRTVLRLAPPAPVSPPSALTPVPVHRPPRHRDPSPRVELELQLPGARNRGPRLPLATSLVPLVSALVLAKFFGPTMLAFAALTPVMALATFLEERRDVRKQERRGAATFSTRLRDAQAQLDAAAEKEKRFRRALYPDIGELVDRCVALGPPLWHRRDGDADFLDVRIGIADQPSESTCRIEGAQDAPERADVERAVRPRTLPSVPVVVPLATVGVMGVAGGRDLVTGVAAGVLVNLATHHSPRELSIVVCSKDFSWSGWLPHATTGGAITDLSDDPTERLEAVADLVEQRASADNLTTSERHAPLVVVIDEAAALPVAPASDVVRRGPSVGVYVVWLASTTQRLPGECRAVVDLTTYAGAVTTFPANGVRIGDVVPDVVDGEVAERAARSLAGGADATAGAAGSEELPTTVTLLDALGLAQVDAKVVEDRWRVAPTGLHVVLGVAGGGVPAAIDLRADGPHGLVGGTTGAGKSELLQTLVASLAATYPPDLVTFVLVDYKGGAAFSDCVDLPHVVGFVTDLDEGLVERALVSLNAEIRRREHVLRAAGCRDLVQLQREQPAEAPPSLLLVVDEFAALARELPSFVDGVVDIAQRGRSLGIHLILATQRPAGVVNDNIRANTNLRIALRMNDRSDSDDVLGSPAAATLPRSRPGRAFVRTGETELRPIQVAHAGAVTARRDESTLRVVGAGAADGADPDALTDVRALVAATTDAFADRGRPAPTPPWLPPLPAEIALAELRGSTPYAIGLVDRPDRQRQETFAFDPRTMSGMVVLGASRSGKTTVLKTIAVTTAQELDPDALHLYVVDMLGTGRLDELAALPHCATAVVGTDLERVGRVMAVLDRTIRRRLQAGYDGREPRLMLMLDGYSAFQAAFEGIDNGALVDLLPRLVTDGRSVGVTTVITADRRGAMSTSLYNALETKLVLRMTDPDEYLAAGLDSRALRTTVLPPGRGVLADGALAQIATADVAAAAAALAGLPRAPQLGMLPERIELPPAGRPVLAASYVRPRIGVDELELQPLELDLDAGHALVTGPPRTGRSSTLAALASDIAACAEPSELYLFAPRRSPLTSLDIWTEQASGFDACDALAHELENGLARDRSNAGWTIVVVDDANELRDSDTDGILETMARRGRDGQVRFLVGADNAQAHRAYSGVLVEVKRDRTGFLLSPNLDMDGDLLGARLPRRQLRWPPGRGYLVAGSTISLAQAYLPG
jgi:S-DNA-T family DNA segregation ATPase FtsK/SpoIIIE